MSAMSLSATRPVASPKQPTDKTIYSIQAMRFIAAALVVVSHIRTEYGMAPFGSAGVDIFFVMSGFIIHYVTRHGAPQFFTRRLIRIVPLYWLGTLGLAGIALVAPSILNQVTVDLPLLLGSLFFWPVWNDSIQYHMPLLMLGWSLNYEILFYLIYFVALKISHQHRLLICSIMLVALAMIHPFVEPTSPLSYWSDAYIIEFIYGMLLAQLVMNTRFLQYARLPMGAAILGFALFCVLLLPSTGLVTPAMAADKGLRVLVIGLPSTALVLLTLACEQSFQKLGAGAKHSINFLGELSYPIYIFHIYVMGLLKRVGALEQSMPVYILLVSISTLALSAAIFVFYEQPVRNYLTRHLIRRPQKAKPTPTIVPPNTRIGASA
ncbi:MAG: acyltransferase [Lautropia sp.]|nr:acyltransferase [Lautropia sp.]